MYPSVFPPHWFIHTSHLFSLPSYFLLPSSLPPSLWIIQSSWASLLFPHHIFSPDSLSSFPVFLLPPLSPFTPLSISLVLPLHLSTALVSADVWCGACGGGGGEGIEPQSGNRSEAAQLHLTSDLATWDQPHELPAHGKRLMNNLHECNTYCAITCWCVRSLSWTCACIHPYVIQGMIYNLSLFRLLFILMSTHSQNMHSDF